jgi:hypothetical protein
VDSEIQDVHQKIMGGVCEYLVSVRLESVLDQYSRVHWNVKRFYEVGSIFEEADGFHRVVRCLPTPSLVGPRWDVYLLMASPEDQLMAEVMLT